MDYLTTLTSLSSIRHGFTSSFVNYKKGCTRLTAASDKVYQLLAHGRWLSPATPASSTTKTGHHDIAEILLKVVLKHQKSNQIKSLYIDSSAIGKAIIIIDGVVFFVEKLLTILIIFIIKYFVV